MKNLPRALSGKLIAISGPDLSGKSTLSSSLIRNINDFYKSIKGHTVSCLGYSFPSHKYRHILEDASLLYPNIIEDIHALDKRSTYDKKMLNFLSQGGVVICDRWQACASAYDTVYRDIGGSHVKVPEADVTVFLDTPYEVIKERFLAAKTVGRYMDFYDNNVLENYYLLREAYLGYFNLLQENKRFKGKIIHIKEYKDAQEVLEMIINA